MAGGSATVDIEALKENESPAFTLADLLIAIRNHRLLIGTLVVGAVLIATAVTKLLTPIYQSSATIYFDPRPPQPLGEKVEPVIDVSADYWNRQEYYNTQHWILTSSSVLNRIVQEQRLQFDKAFIEQREGVDMAAKPVLSLEQASAVLASRLEVSPIDQSRLARLSLQDADKERAKRILSAITLNYVNQNEEELSSATTEAATWLRDQLATLRTELEKSEIALHDYKKSNNLLSVSLDDQSGMLREEINQLNVALTESKTRREKLRARSSELSSVDENDPTQLPARELLESKVLQDLRASYLDAVRKESRLLASGKGKNHPEVQGVTREVETGKKALVSEIKNIKSALQHDVGATEREIRGLETLVAQAQTKALEVNQLEIEYRRLRRHRDTNERLFTLVTERSKESDLARMLRLNNVRIIEPPSTPQGPVSPSLPLNMLAGAVAGLLLGIGGAVGREQLDRTIKGPQDAETTLDSPLLGVLPASAEEKPAPALATRRGKGKAGPQLEFAAFDKPTGNLAEAARAVRTAIMFSSTDKPLRRLLVTSAGAGEGKTTIACNLGITLAQTGKRVLLIDGDLRRPRLHRVFEQHDSPGLTGVLLAPESFRTTPRPTKIPNLSVLPAGVLPPNPSELLHGTTFSELLQNLESEYDILVIDSPPLLPVTDGAVLAPQVDGVVLVVRAQRTARADAQRALALLKSVGSRPLGTVLNALSDSAQGYGYYYQSGYYSSDSTLSDSPKT